jgi:hypothetical protein
MGYVYKKKDIQAFSSSTRLPWVEEGKLDQWRGGAQLPQHAERLIKNWRWKYQKK